MRLVARRRGCPYAVTEALLDTIMLAGGHGLRKSIDINDEDHPIAGQIIGSDADTMSRAAKILVDYKYDVVDLNFACPVKKIKNKARGGHMLRDIERGRAIINAVRDTVPEAIPVTVSLRRSFEDSPESIDLFHELVESAWAAGLAAIRVHARTVEQKYLGRADWSILRDIKQRYPNKVILGSGDVFTPEDAVRMLRETGVDAVWIARGAIGNPWIFKQSTELIAPDPSPLTPPTLHSQRDALREHFAIAMEIHGEQLAGRRMRKMGIKYSRFHPDHEQVKRAFIEIRSLREWDDVLDRHYGSDGPGVFPDPRAADEVNDEQAIEA